MTLALTGNIARRAGRRRADVSLLPPIVHIWTTTQVSPTAPRLAKRNRHLPSVEVGCVQQQSVGVSIHWIECR
jgi:hypothetical protein